MMLTLFASLTLAEAQATNVERAYVTLTLTETLRTDSLTRAYAPEKPAIPAMKSSELAKIRCTFD